ncbi:signal peptidase I [Niallia circulans]|uniref:Signal peptidase I n=1 Tax=Niallia circulans TaxID=1397 RepID=A0A553SIH3_NIACI|nr:signal peptidase I [Niallia circulans]TRZ36790.1 signal peptidase I [Niallia circulans]
MSKQTKKEIYSWAKTIVFCFLLVFICRQFVYAPIIVDGKAMMPTLENNNRILVNKITSIDRFDVIVFHSPVSSAYYIKRVIGLSGDNIEVKDDSLYVNGKKYDEPYLQANKEILAESHLTADLKETVPEGYLYVMGDNRLKSNDSRLFGVISKEDVVGKAALRVFSF